VKAHANKIYKASISKKRGFYQKLFAQILNKIWI